MDGNFGIDEGREVLLGVLEPVDLQVGEPEVDGRGLQRGREGEAPLEAPDRAGEVLELERRLGRHHPERRGFGALREARLDRAEEVVVPLLGEQGRKIFLEGAVRESWA